MIDSDEHELTVSIESLNSAITLAVYSIVYTKPIPIKGCAASSSIN